MNNDDKLITLAIHTYEKALILKTLLENEGIPVVINNVNLIQPVVSSGVRVRIRESDLPLALKIIENTSLISSDDDKNRKLGVILIPVDFSDYSVKACSIGFDFAKKQGVDVVLLHTYLAVDYIGSMPYDSPEMPLGTDAENLNDAKMVASAAAARMKNFEKNLRQQIAAAELPDVKFSTKVLEGVPETMILYVAKQMDVSLIVMGTRGKDKKEVELIGSVTAEVLDACKYPVFTVPEGVVSDHVDSISNVVFFTNFNQQDLISFDEFARMFEGSPLNVTIVPVVVRNSDSAKTAQYLDALVKYCTAQYKDFTFTSEIVADRHFLDDFDGLVSQSKINLILVPNKKRNIFARLFNPSIAHRMLFHSDVPMLVIPI